MAAGEKKAYDGGKHEGMNRAMEAGKKQPVSWLDTAAHDGDCHAKMLEGIGGAYFRQPALRVLPGKPCRRFAASGGAFSILV